MRPEKLKVAVIGVGYGQAHLAAFDARGDVEIVAVVARRRENAEKVGARFGATLRTTSYREALNLDQLDAVAIAKFWAAEGGQRVVHAATHVHGGVGVDRDYPLHRFFLLTRQIELTLGGATQSLLALGARAAASA